MPESIETTIHVTIPIPMRRESIKNAVPEVIDELKESYAELTISGKDESTENMQVVDKKKKKLPKEFFKPSIMTDPLIETIEKSTGLKITGGSDFNMPITIFHVRNEKNNNFSFL